MSWFGLCYGQRTQVHFIDVILKAQRFSNETSSVSFIDNHHLVLQYDGAQSHVAMILTQFLEAENIPVLAWPVCSLDMSPIEPVWMLLIDIYDGVFQVLPIFSNFTQVLKRGGRRSAALRELVILMCLLKP